MKSAITLTLDRDDIEKMIPYALICETRFGAAWHRRGRKQRWEQEFSAPERYEAEILCRQAWSWHLKSGVPSSQVMTSGTFAMWVKLAKFCASLTKEDS